MRCRCWVIVALTDRYKRLQDRTVDKSKQSWPMTSAIASLELWLNEAEQDLTSCQSSTLDSIAQLESAVRRHRVCIDCMCASLITGISAILTSQCCLNHCRSSPSPASVCRALADWPSSIPTAHNSENLVRGCQGYEKFRLVSC